MQTARPANPELAPARGAAGAYSGRGNTGYDAMNGGMGAMGLGMGGMGTFSPLSLEFLNK